MPTVSGKPSSAASISSLTNSLELTRTGYYITFLQILTDLVCLFSWVLHTAETMLTTHEVSENKIISKALWPPRSLILAIWFSSLMMYSKEAYKNKPHNTEAPQSKIAQVTASVSKDKLQKLSHSSFPCVSHTRRQKKVTSSRFYKNLLSSRKLFTVISSDVLFK
jgi:hypothetical protein